MGFTGNCCDLAPCPVLHPSLAALLLGDGIPPRVEGDASVLLGQGAELLVCALPRRTLLPHTT